MVDVAERAGLDEFVDLAHGGVEAVDNADVEDLAGLVLRLLHFEGVGVGARGGLFAKDVLACS